MRRWILLCAITMAACSGASSSVPGPDGGSDAGADASPLPGVDASPTDAQPRVDGSADAGPGLPASFRLASLDDPCDGVATLTGRSLVTRLVAAYAATYTPRSGTATPLEIKATYQGGAILCFPHFTSNGGAPDMPARIEITVQLEFKTDDGTFDERLDGTITSRFGGQSLDLSATLPIGAVKGRYVPMPMPGFDKIDLGIGGTLGPGAATTGNVMQWGAISTPPPPGQVNPGVTQPAGSWK